MNLKSVVDANTEGKIEGKRVLLRVDFNVPIKDGKVVDDSRIRAALPTLHFILEKNPAKVTILSHLGRPDGKEDPAFSLAPVEAQMRTYIDDPRVTFHPNVRFNPGEEANDPAFAKELASLGDVFVNDAFAVSHRAHASTVGIAALLPSYAGLLMQNEVEKLSQALTPPKGSIAILGGAKFETKIPLMEKLLPLYGTMLVGGALGNDIIKARGMPFGASLVSETPAPTSIASADQTLLVASDVTVQDTKTNVGRTALVSDIRADEAIVDIGSTTAAEWANRVTLAPFVLWSGPVGVYEKGFVEGTEVLALALAQSGARAVIGGGDTGAAISKFTFDPEKVFVSTGGGAMLQFLVDGTLPGLEVLKKTT